MTVFDKSRLKHLSTRELQAYGAACLATFCANKGISSPYVDALIAHLLSVLTCSDLPGWETAGARLELTGRGDPLPPGLLASLRSDMLPILQHLVDSVVEIGLVDMYTAETERPFEFLLRTTTILELQGVHPPSIGELFPSRGAEGIHGWGSPVNGEQYESAREWCARVLEEGRMFRSV